MQIRCYLPLPKIYFISLLYLFISRYNQPFRTIIQQNESLFLQQSHTYPRHSTAKLPSHDSTGSSLGAFSRSGGQASEVRVNTIKVPSLKFCVDACFPWATASMKKLFPLPTNRFIPLLFRPPFLDFMYLACSPLKTEKLIETIEHNKENIALRLRKLIL